MIEMIQFVRVEKTVHVLTAGGPLNSLYRFEFNCGDEHYAELLQQHFSRNLFELVESIRKEEYERGYREGRGKKTKKTWFSCLLKRGMA